MEEKQHESNTYPIERQDDNFTIAEYIWLGGTGWDIRSKTKIYNKRINDISDLEMWNFDGSSTGQAETRNSEILLKPVSIFKDPFRRKNAVLVLCETIESDGKTPALANFRDLCNQVMEEARASEPWFGIEQEYVIFARKRGSNLIWPFGWPEGGYPGPQGQYYCSVGPGNAYGRAVAETHLRACLYAGVKICGINAEVLPSQWEFQIGPCEGIQMGDHLWMARYILFRLCEEFNVDVSFEPKPFRTGDWNGSGCHTNISTKETRAPGGIKVIHEYMKNFEAAHSDHLKVYGENNQYRLTGRHETASITTFAYGVGNRGASVRIPVNTDATGQGYFEDRRPASNIDPYLVTGIIVDTMLLNRKYGQQFVKIYEDFKIRSRMEERSHM